MRPREIEVGKTYIGWSLKAPRTVVEIREGRLTYFMDRVGEPKVKTVINLTSFAQWARKEVSP